MKKILFLAAMSSFIGWSQTPTISFDFNGDLTSAGAGAVTLSATGGIPSYTYDRFGNANSSCNLYNTNGNISLDAFIASNYLPFANDPRTISFWVHYIGHDSDNGNEVNLIKQGAPSATGSIFSLRQAQKSVYFLGNGSDVTPADEDVFRFDTQNWYHYVVSFDGTQIAMYRNGNLIAQSGPSPANTSIFTSNTAFSINPAGSINTNGYGFVIDDLDIYDIVLTEQDVRNMYIQDSPLNQVALVGYFPFNASTAYSDVAFNHAFAQDGTTPAPVLSYGYDDLGLHFTSGQIFSNNTVVPELDGSFTVAYWQKRNSVPVQSYETSMELGASAFDRTFYTTTAYRDNFGMAVGSTPSWADFSVPEPGSGLSYIAYGEWQHHAFVFDTLTNQLFYYINGELRKSLGVIAGGIHTFTNKMTLGGGTDGNGVVQAIKSCTDFDLDELFVFNRALSQVEIMALRYQHAVPFICPTGDVTLSTQQDVNDLWSCTHITGNLTIDDGGAFAITDLSPLNNITTIDGDVTIQNLDITSIDALNGLTSLGGSITISGNQSTGIAGFGALTHIPGNFTIELNTYLNFIHGFTNLQKIGTDENLGNWTISDNPGIQFMFDYPTLDTITGRLTISNAPAIADNITAFEELDFVDALHLVATGFDHLTAFSNLTRIGQDLAIQSNSSLMDLAGMENIIEFTTSQGIIEISGNMQLSDLDELTGINFNSPLSITIQDNDNLLNVNGLSSITGDLGQFAELIISDNFLLNDLTGFSGITAVSNLVIDNNTDLSSINGLNGFTHFNSALNAGIQLTNNPSLTSISGLNGVDVNTITSVNIQNNSSLATCNENWICDYLGSSSPNATISNNATGCNSDTEVSSTCGLGLIDEQQIHVTIFPNPAETFIEIEGLESGVMELEIVNLEGSSLIKTQLLHVDISTLPAGVYFVKGRTDSELFFIEKIVKL
ncbi:MAG: T9SS type A sorting domain-containing protein [Crocinitomicaceae bacterium]|nr:MAG: T9SS type A sorting domain-containing protein [Crocinitomicaceae bacterium]